MASRFSMASLVLIFLVLLPLGTASADVRAQSACPFLSTLFTNAPRIGSSPGGRCFSGHSCWVGVRGDWLDLTGDFSIVSGPRADIEIDDKGVDDSGSLSGDCIPRSNKDREGYVRLKLQRIDGDGTMRIRLNRPGGSDTISVEVLDGETFLASKQDGSFADAGVPKVFTLKGGHLDRLRLKQVNRVSGLTGMNSINTVDAPTHSFNTNADEILSRTGDTARVRLTFPENGTVSLETRLEFEGGEPELNARFGWPAIIVHRPNGAQNPPPPPPAQGGSGGVTIGGSSTPNLTPVRLFAERPLLRKINTLSSLMVPMFYCAALGNNEEREVDVPAFEWGVANDNRSSINQAFSVAVLTGATGSTTLATQNVTLLPQSDTRTFRNWPGRPSRVRVVKVTGPPLMSEYNNSAGCYIPNGLVGKVTLDPKPLIIRVDSSGQITERDEPDNDLVIQ